jgi:tetratricopeptide (TPR) repeat protein
VRRFAIGLSLLVAWRGEARSEIVPVPAQATDPDRGVFWRDVIEPHKEELDLIRAKARYYLNSADQGMSSYDFEQAPRTHERIYREIYGMLRYARRLAPGDVEVLALLGRTADAIGKTREAIEALQMAVQIAGPERAGIEVTGRLGAIYLRLGQLDDAIRYLKLAQSPIATGLPITAHALIDLSTALALDGEMSDAIDLLSNSLPAALPAYSGEAVLVDFALAVQYDRDEQPSAAFDVIDHLETALQGQGLVATVQNAMVGMRFAPAEDEHYFHALLYEIGGYYAEARADWALYAAIPDAPWRGRALDHIAAIDAERRKPVVKKDPAVVPTILHRRSVVHP